MSENSSEYLKRTCLICGCHTNQTINIYEPRSGPNIVQLIQAKFKFQPVNEDKYLCFSCNNWLVNWHSLQALNSNDAESPSGTFGSQLNSGNVVQDEKSSGSKKQVAICRPIAHVRPRLAQESTAGEQLSAADTEPTVATDQEDSGKSSPKINFNKRHFRMQLARRSRLQHNSMQQCVCGKYIVVRTSVKFLKNKSVTHARCRKCREFSRLKANYMRSVAQVERELAIREPPLQLEQENEIASLSQTILQQRQQQQPQRLCFPKPLVDGKVVAMLRRLGTTLSRESHSTNKSSALERLPQIMSPNKPSPKWMRPLEDNEVLLNFDASISEILPSLSNHSTHMNSSAVRRRLAFQVSETAEVIDLCETDDHAEAPGGMEECQAQGLQQLDNQFASTLGLPKGLTITLA